MALALWASWVGPAAARTPARTHPGTGAPVLYGMLLQRAPGGRALLLDVSGPVEPVVTAVEGAGGLVRLYLDLPPGSRATRGLGRGLRGDPIVAARVGQGDTGGVRIVVEVEGAAGWRLGHEASGRRLALTVIRGAAPVSRPGTTAAAGNDAATPAARDAATPAGSDAAGPLGKDAAIPSRSDAAAPPVTPTATAALEPGVGRPSPLRATVVLDPGHGGDDPGAIGFAVEKEVTLDLALRVAALLRRRLGVTVVLTRSADVTLTLGARTQRANAEDADLFVSIHANANPGGTLEGIETYVLDDSEDRAVLRLASMENGLDMLGPARSQTDLRYILSDLVQRGKMEDSVALASAIQRELVAGLRSRYPGVADLGVKRGPFYVLVGAYMPCVLVEASFVTHAVEGRRLATADYRAAAAEGIYAGIARFLRDGAHPRPL